MSTDRDSTRTGAVQVTYTPQEIRIDLPVAGGLLAHCRKLLDEGHDPRDIAMVYRNGTQCFTPTRLGWFAARSTSEGDTSVRYVWFAPYPGAEAPKSITVGPITGRVDAGPYGGSLGDDKPATEEDM